MRSRKKSSIEFFHYPVMNQAMNQRFPFLLCLAFLLIFTIGVTLVESTFVVAAAADRERVLRRNQGSSTEKKLFRSRPKDFASARLSSSAAGVVQFQVNLDRQTPFEHFWERSVGSCHAALGNRQDWRDQLTKVHSELGFQMVRFHGLLDEDMSVVLQDRYGKQFYSFYNVDYLFDFILKLGMKPLVELSYMPDLLASGPETLFHYKANVSPPKSHHAWYDLIYQLVKHLVGRYGIDEVASWYFEVWNEPNNGAFWSGTQQQYFELYNTSAVAIKTVSQRLRVGGPATMQSLWVDDFIQYCQRYKVPFDFVSTHEYPTDFQPFTRDNLRIALTKTRALVDKMVSKNFPLLYTEYNAGLDDIGGGTQFFQDSSYAAAFVVKSVLDVDGVVDVLSYWTFSDIFEEHGMKSEPFNGQFGMLTIQGIAKPVYRAFQLLHMAGDRRNQVLYSTNTSTVDVLSVMSREKKEVMLFVSNFDVPDNVPRSYVALVNVNLESGYKLVDNSATLVTVDENSSNAFTQWKKMGKPAYPTQSELKLLHEASELKPRPIQFTMDGQSKAIFKLELAPYSLSVITVELQ